MASIAFSRVGVAVLAAASLATSVPAVRAAEPYQINVILPLTGNIAFVGTTQLQALKAVEAYVNRTGGIAGRQIAFVVSDDQGDPKTALQLAQGLIAKNVPLILGPSSPQGCDAIAPLINPQNGPLFKSAIGTMTRELSLTGNKPDMIEISAWDPAMVVVDALRKAGTDASAAKLHAYLVKLRNWPGVNGPYDFVANPQRGIGENNIVMVRWDQAQNQAFAVSKLGGAPLAGK